jgi:hypothetical protein
VTDVSPRVIVVGDELPQLAAAIRDEVEQAEADFRSAVAHAIRAGELLIEAKAQVAHGGWLPWLDVECRLKRSEAANYMRLARNVQRVAHLPSIRQAVALLAAPKREPAEEEPPVLTVDPPAHGVELPPIPLLNATREMDVILDSFERDELDLGETLSALEAAARHTPADTEREDGYERTVAQALADVSDPDYLIRYHDAARHRHRRVCAKLDVIHRALGAEIERRKETTSP